MASPTPRSGIGVVPMASQGRFATQGMISPTDPPFVDPTTGRLAPTSFRFLYDIFNRVNALATAVATLQGVLAAGQFSATASTATPPSQSQGATNLGVFATFTAPAGNNRALCAIDCMLGSSSAGGTGMMMMNWGTGAPPSAGSPPGQLLGQLMSYTSPTANAQTPASESAILSGLVAGTQYWVGIIGASTQGNSYVTNIDLNIIGLVDPGA